MTRQKSREATAYARARILAPLLNGTPDRALRAQILKTISQENGVSERTLRRWLTAYAQNGFEGLLPAKRDLSVLRVIPESVVDMAVTLRREVPERSVADIIRLLEYEGYIEEGSVKRSTLQDQLCRRGYGTRQLAMYRSAGVGAARRFERTGRNSLWQADIKYLLVLPATSKGPARQLYASAFIDDATRMVTGIRVYDRQDVHCVLDCFRHAMESYGVPDRLFTDNGRVYIGRQLKQTCTKLAISLLRTRPYAAQAKGKVEALNRTLEKFVVEEKLEHPSSVEQVQHDLDCWMESFYYDVPHSALNGKTPRQAFRENRKIQRFVSADELNRAFRTTESRLVDKTGCLAFGGRKWEAGPEYIGFKVDVSYASDNPTELIVEYPHMEPKVIHELRIGEHTTERRKPRPFIDANGSRILEAARQRKENSHDRTGAIRFKDID
jgi:putative transposase